MAFTPTISGTYALHLLLDGARPLAGGPFPIRVKTDETAAANSRLFGPGLTRARAGQATTFQIQGAGYGCGCQTMVAWQSRVTGAAGPCVRPQLIH